MHQDLLPISPARRQAARRRRLAKAGRRSIKIFVSPDVHALLRRQVHIRHLPAADVIELALRELPEDGKP